MLQEVTKSKPVKYLAALMFRHHAVLEQCKSALEQRIGKIERESEIYAFVHSDYYEQEMGPGLQKQFVSFQELRQIEAFVDFKLACMGLESEFAENERRQVNIDPAYLELAKLVVGTRKNFDHRIYLGRGVYGDVQLRYRNHNFIANEWTYPDYRSEAVVRFLKKVRADYYKQLQEQE